MAINWLVSSQLLRAKLATTVSSAAIACIYLLAGIPSLVDLTFDLTAGQVDTHVLTTLAVFGTLAIGGAFEGALLLVLFQVSHTVEHELTHRAAGDLRSLFDSIPQHAVLVKLQADGAPDLSNTEQAKARDVAIGSLMLVKAGEQVALDGQIVYGEAMVSTEHITGEALPSRRRKGDEVPAGALNHDGVLVVRALRRSADSTPARIAKLTSDAQAMRPELRRWLDDFGEAYSKGVIAATLAALVILPLTGVPLVGSGAERGAMYRAMGLLTTASPCALVLVPLAYVSAIAAVTSRGMLIKGGRVLDALARCSTVAFDKTGTLTTGAMACTAMLAPDQALNTKVEPTAPGKWVPAVVQGANQDDKHALATAVALSLRSNHPASRATAACGKAASGALPNVNITDFKLVPGAGVQGFVERGGQRRFARFGSCEFAAEILPQQEADALAQAVDRPASKQSAKDAIRVMMLTGDNASSAGRVSRHLGITEVHAGLTPKEKLQAVQGARTSGTHSARGNGVLMVGDGINDAPALAAADVGLAIASTPNEAAAAAADVIVLTDDGASAIPFLLAVADRTQRQQRHITRAVGALTALALYERFVGTRAICGYLRIASVAHAITQDNVPQHAALLHIGLLKRQSRLRGNTLSALAVQSLVFMGRPRHAALAGAFCRWATLVQQAHNKVDGGRASCRLQATTAGLYAAIATLYPAP
ncbi:hypothetical protein WJX72_002746 [[Myrmecia] bisecta]|uniref:P-type ATPase A domain-containing protein n=1 Tax=[Myrmecia] bisecta TaxID=41462 RepID=A0AAW1PSC8_9CHLO